MTGPESSPPQVARLEQEIDRLRRINHVLMDRAERGLAASDSAFGAFQRAVALEEIVTRRTQDLITAKELAEAQARELKHQAIELEQARLTAEAAQQAKSEFLANTSHEIRTPLTAILGFADTLLDPELTTAERLEAAQIIRDNGQALLQTLGDILDLSKAELGKLVIQPTTCSVRELMADVLSLMRPRADAKGLALTLSYAGTIPDTIHTDPGRLKQILINLLDNAVKFTAQGSVALIVRLLGAEERHPMMQFDILDTGIGMTPEQVDHLFEPSTPARGSIARRFGGTGMGLCICRRLAELLGGEIVAESQPGKCSTLRLTIAIGPLERSQPTNQPATTPALIAASASKLYAAEEPLRCRILLAEDGPDNQRLFSFILKKAGAQVDIADNGKIAVEKATAGEPYDVILMDIQMPLMDGYTATSQLRARRYPGTIIALTAHAMASDRQACIQAGCDDYATKPIDQRMLIAMIREHLRRPALRA